MVFSLLLLVLMAQAQIDRLANSYYGASCVKFFFFASKYVRAFLCVLYFSLLLPAGEFLLRRYDNHTHYTLTHTYTHTYTLIHTLIHQALSVTYFLLLFFQFEIVFRYSNIYNPVDKAMVFLSRYYPLDYVAFTLMVCFSCFKATQAHVHAHIHGLHSHGLFFKTFTSILTFMHINMHYT